MHTEPLCFQDHTTCAEEANLSTAGAWCLLAALVIDESQIPVPCRSLYLGQMVVK